MFHLSFRRCTFVVLLMLWPFAVLQASPLPIPTYEEHKAFLYGDWKANRPSAILFIDPFCPYCKRAIPKLNTIQHYNLFVFWSPIFGDRSEKAIAPFFQCAEPTAKPILDGVVVDPMAAPTVCRPNADSDLRQRNDSMVAAYNVNAVPSYYLQGRRTSLSALREAPKLGLPSLVQGVALPWARYTSSKLLDASEAYSAAILFPSDTPEPMIKKALAEFKPQYMFSANQWEQLCHVSPTKACQQDDVRQQQPGSYMEVIALLGIQPRPLTPIVIKHDGSLGYVEPQP